MFSKSAAEPAGDDVVPSDLIPLSVLALDLQVPVGGWANFLGARAIKIQPDDLGRDSVSRGEAKRLLDEQRADEVRQAAQQARLEREAVERDREYRAQLYKGIPASAVPLDTLPAAAMLQAAKDDRPKRESVLEHALANPAGGFTYHELPRGEE